MKKTYISPQSATVQLYPAHMLAGSLHVDTDIDVDESDKSAAREWTDESFDFDEE